LKSTITVFLNISHFLLRDICQNVYYICLFQEYCFFFYFCKSNVILLKSDQRDLNKVRKTLGRKGPRYLINQFPVHDGIDVLCELVQQEPITEVEYSYDTFGLRFLEHANRTSQKVHSRPGLRENYDSRKRNTSIDPTIVVIFVL